MSPHPDVPSTSPEIQLCDRCGKALPAADAECVTCDAELSASGSPIPSGKHICPSCGLSFAKPDLTLEPADAKWYVPQMQGFQCPHCKVGLLDSRDPKMPSYQVAALIVLALCTQFLLPAAHVRTGLIVLVIVYLAIYLCRRSWGVPDSRRYVTHAR